MISHEATEITQPLPEGTTKKRKHEDDSQDCFITKQVEASALETGSRHDLDSANHVCPVSLPNEIVSESPTSKFHEETGRKSKRLKKVPNSKSDNYPTITFSEECRLQSQIRIRDLQSLALYILADGESPQFVSVRNRPQIRKVVIIMVPGLELSMFTDSESQKDSSINLSSDYYPIKLQSDKLAENVKQFATMFDHVWPVKTPGNDKFMKMYSPLHAMLIAPIPKSIEEIQTKEKRKGASVAKEPEGWKNQRIFIAELLHSREELVENEYTLHPASYESEAEKLSLLEYRRSVGTSTDDGWLDTHVTSLNGDAHPEPGSLTTEDNTVGNWKVLAMDCEMCMTGESKFSLTRISIVSWDGTVIMDEFVKPAEPITNYLTQYSGITEDLLKNVTTTLSDIQDKLLKIIHSDTILIGHSLNSDLTALKITHPYIVDTAIIFPHPRGPPLKSSLKFLAQRYLDREIQKGHGAIGPGAGHDSIEDAKTCLDLVKQKCEKGKAWGTFEAQGESIFKRVARTGRKFKCQQILPTGQPSIGRTSAAVDWGDPQKGPGAAADFPISCKSDDEVMRGVLRAVTGDPDGKEIPGGGVDFVWARLRELEALRGWSNNNRQAGTSAPRLELLTADLPIKSDEDTSAPATTAVTQASDIPPSTTTQAEEQAIAEMTQRIFHIYSALPPCTAVILYSGSGCPLEMSRLQALHTTFKREYKTKKWDQLSVQWTDVEEQALRRANLVARHGLGFVGVK